MADGTGTSDCDVIMRAVKVQDGKPVLVEVEKPSPGRGEVLIRVIRAGICSTDKQILKGYVAEFTSVLGHEFVGRIESHGEGVSKDMLGVGSTVVADINLVCHSCDACKVGGIKRRNHCAKRTVIGIRNKDGAMADFLVLPAENCHVVPESIPLRAAVFAEPLGAAYRIVEQISTNPTDRIAVIGDGKLGLLVTEVMKTQPHKHITLFGRHKDKMSLIDGIEAIETASEGEGDNYKDMFDLVVEASGSSDGLIFAGQICKQMGTVILKTTCSVGSKEFNSAPFVVKEICVLGSRCGNLKMALESMAFKEIDVEKFITREYPFDKAEEAFSHAAQKGTLKIQLVMTEE